MPTSQQMQVQMEHGLPGAAAVVEHGAIAGEQVSLRRQLCGHHLQFAQQRLVGALRVMQRRKMPAWANQNVRRRLRTDVFEREHVVVFIDKLRGNFLCADFAEKAIRVHRPINLEKAPFTYIGIHYAGLKTGHYIISHRGAPRRRKSLRRCAAFRRTAGPLARRKSCPRARGRKCRRGNHTAECK